MIFRFEMLEDLSLHFAYFNVEIMKPEHIYRIDDYFEYKLAQHDILVFFRNFHPNSWTVWRGTNQTNFLISDIRAGEIVYHDL